MIWRPVLLAVIFAGTRFLQHFFYTSIDHFQEGLLVVVENQNGAFSLPISSSILIPLALGIMVIVLSEGIRLYRQKDPHMFWWGLIFIGALSNIADRFYYGSVIDYISLGFWPVFNLADVCISVGVFFLIVTEIRKNRKSNN